MNPNTNKERGRKKTTHEQIIFVLSIQFRLSPVLPPPLLATCSPQPNCCGCAKSQRRVRICRNRSRPPRRCPFSPFFLSHTWIKVNAAAPAAPAAPAGWPTSGASTCGFFNGVVALSSTYILSPSLRLFRRGPWWFARLCLWHVGCGGRQLHQGTLKKGAGEIGGRERCGGEKEETAVFLAPFSPSSGCFNAEVFVFFRWSTTALSSGESSRF